MKLLFVTQQVDADAPILGFVVRWLKEFSSQYEQITVIAHSVGAYDLPENVRVISLGKECGAGRIVRTIRYWKLAWQLRHEYDVVFVHMTPIMVVLNSLLWCALRKPMYLWYESSGRRWPLWIAAFFVKKIFSATSLHLRFFAQKNTVTNHGIDITFWSPALHQKTEQLVVAVGRVTPIKRTELIIDCFAALPSTYHLLLIGGPYVGRDFDYALAIDNRIAALGLRDRVDMHFLPSCQTREVVGRAALFLHASKGTLDKAVLQAMAAGVPVVSCSNATRDILPEVCQAEPATFAQKAAELLRNPDARASAVRQASVTVRERHSLHTLSATLRAEMRLPAQYPMLRASLVACCLLLAGCTTASDTNRGTIQMESEVGVQ